MSNKIECPWCFRRIDADFTVCPKCGQSTVVGENGYVISPGAKIECPWCYEMIDASSTVCPECGESIDADSRLEAETERLAQEREAQSARASQYNVPAQSSARNNVQKADSTPERIAHDVAVIKKCIIFFTVILVLELICSFVSTIIVQNAISEYLEAMDRIFR